jgi:hypothetical protein
MDNKQRWERVLAAVEADARRAEALLIADEAPEPEPEPPLPGVPAEWLLPSNAGTLLPVDQLPPVPAELRDRIEGLRDRILALQSELAEAVRTAQQAQRLTAAVPATPVESPLYVDRRL